MNSSLVGDLGPIPDKEIILYRPIDFSPSKFRLFVARNTVRFEEVRKKKISCEGQFDVKHNAPIYIIDLKPSVDNLFATTTFSLQ